MSNLFFILGADDPEMSAIENMLKENGCSYFYAVTEVGRVIPATTYNAVALQQPDGAILSERNHDLADIVSRSVLVECDFPGQTPAGRCDHHRPADPGYGKPPSEFLSASSIGQVVSLLAKEGDDNLQGWDGWNCTMLHGTQDGDFWFHAARDGRQWWAVRSGRYGFVVPQEIVLAAAADHCLAAAYAGQCPGVYSGVLAEYRITQLCSASRASNRGAERTPEEIRASIEAAMTAIQAASWIPLLTESGCVPAGGYCDTHIQPVPACGAVVDLRGPMIPDLPEAAMILGVGYLAGGVPLREGDAPKVVIGGCGAGTVPGTTPVEAFLSDWAVQNLALADVPEPLYGDPVRGFAGAYIKSEGE